MDNHELMAPIGLLGLGAFIILVSIMSAIESNRGESEIDIVGTFAAMFVSGLAGFLVGQFFYPTAVVYVVAASAVSACLLFVGLKSAMREEPAEPQEPEQPDDDSVTLDKEE